MSFILSPFLQRTAQAIEVVEGRGKICFWCSYIREGKVQRVYLALTSKVSSFTRALSSFPPLSPPWDLRISSQTWRITIPLELHGIACFTAVNPAWIAQPVPQKLQTTLLYQVYFYLCAKTQKLRKSLLRRILHTVRCRSAVLQTKDRNVSRRMSDSSL